MQSFAMLFRMEKEIEELYKLIWYVPKGDEYSSKYIEEMRKAQKDTEEQYEKIYGTEWKKKRK